MEKSILRSFKTLLKLATNEDLSKQGDITSNAIIDSSDYKLATLTAKESMLICGIPFIDYIASIEKKKIEIKKKIKEGTLIKKGQTIALIKGNTRKLLFYERIILNMLQHLSGIASMTYEWKKEITSSKIKLLDTRKTIPAYRVLEKYACKTGGGINHRLGLYDAYMIKDNHFKVEKNIDFMIKQIKKHNKNHKLIEVECVSLKWLESLPYKDIDVVMLDNMGNEDIKKAIKIIKKRAKIEVSGNITKKRLQTLSHLGIDYISCGALTHSAKAKDISMKIIDL